MSIVFNYDNENRTLNVLDLLSSYKLIGKALLLGRTPLLYSMVKTESSTGALCLANLTCRCWYSNIY